MRKIGRDRSTEGILASERERALSGEVTFAYFVRVSDDVRLNACATLAVVLKLAVLAVTSLDTKCTVVSAAQSAPQRTK